MMKGWIDRVFAPEAAYTFAKGADSGDDPIGLLRTRAALILNTGNTPAEREKITSATRSITSGGGASSNFAA